MARLDSFDSSPYSGSVVDVRMSVIAATGDTPHCALIQSELKARTYTSDGTQPSAPARLYPALTPSG